MEANRKFRNIIIRRIKGNYKNESEKQEIENILTTVDIQVDEDFFKDVRKV